MKVYMCREDCQCKYVNAKCYKPHSPSPGWIFKPVSSHVSLLLSKSIGTAIGFPILLCVGQHPVKWVISYLTIQILSTACIPICNSNTNSCILLIQSKSFTLHPQFLDYYLKEWRLLQPSTQSVVWHKAIHPKRQESSFPPLKLHLHNHSQLHFYPALNYTSFPLRFTSSSL